MVWKVLGHFCQVSAVEGSAAELPLSSRPQGALESTDLEEGWGMRVATADRTLGAVGGW